MHLACVHDRPEALDVVAKAGVPARGPARSAAGRFMFLFSPAAKAARFNPPSPQVPPYRDPLPPQAQVYRGPYFPFAPPPLIVPLPHRIPIPPPVHTVPFPHRLFAPPAAALPTPWLPFRLIVRTDDDREGEPLQWIAANTKGVRRGIRPRYMPNPYKGFKVRSFLVGPYLHHLGRYSFRSIGGFPDELLPHIPRFPLLEPFGPADLAP